jgi:acyl-CoA reductase-like NAD-dependent aldehyde dehydrogenase
MAAAPSARRTSPVARGIARDLAAAREAQREWAGWPLEDRLRVVREIRHGLAAGAGKLAGAVLRCSLARRSEAEVLSSEIVPLADACRFLEREAPRLLAPRRLGAEGRPGWLAGVESEVRREPLGVVLILAPSSYPLFLAGVQALQALAAGNAVLWKPGRGGYAAAWAFAELAVLSGLDWRLLSVLEATDEAGREAIAAGPDKVVLTGSAATGRKVLADLGERLIPATAELSGCDALFVLPEAGAADLERAALAIRFGLTLNGGATCIAPRRVFVPAALAKELEERLGNEGLLGSLELVPVAGIEQALALAAQSPYALGASIFGPEEPARALAGRVRAGVVVVNDVIVPTADPRLPFGGRGESGYGVTRGAEGLLDLTAVKVVAVRRGRRLRHLEEARPGDAEIFRAWLRLAHGGGLRERLAGGVSLVRAVAGRGKDEKHGKDPEGFEEVEA